MKDFKIYDVFKSFLVEDAEYDGYIELPKIKTSDLIPDKVVTFSKAMEKSFKDFGCHVMFYEHDAKFERLWNNPIQYLPKLKKFKGVISPDFSLYRNMPLCMQMWNAYRGRALAYWMQKNGIEIIPNIRFNDARTYSFCFDGIEPFKTVAVGTHGCIKKKEDKKIFKQGLKELVRVLQPKTIIIYGAVPDEIFGGYRKKGINIIAFESEYSKSRRQVNA
ncbi:MAG: DUF4417 domain-containing protein [Clostridia bacterium]